MKLTNPFFLFLFLIALFQTKGIFGQYPNHELDQYPVEWNSRWISHPEIDGASYNLLHFRKVFEMEEVPDQFIVHVSGDNRYRLYVNGEEVCYGPQLADVRHWRYETVDLAPYLKEGKNVIGAQVMNWGIDRSYGIISHRTAFLLQGYSRKETFLNTDYDSNWKVLQNKAMHEKTVHWITGDQIVGGFYASNPTDSVVAENYPWKWKEAGYIDHHWKEPKVLFSKPKTNAGAGHGWILQPRTTPIQKSEKEPFTRIARTSMDKVGEDFQFGQKSLKVRANSQQTIILDQGYVTLGYPKLHLSKGKGAHVQVKYTEALYNAANNKGNRNRIEGKTIKGISDVYMMDGGENRVFQPIWFRTFRFVQLEIKTKNQPLVIDDFYNVFSASPIHIEAKFNTHNPVYEKVWEVCSHGLDICAQDNLLSDAYYEQMQYVGDLRPHLKAWTALTGDLTYFRSAMEQFNNSRLPDGNITSCYPLKATFVHPTYSLIWIDMLHDLMMLDGNKKLIESYLGEIQEVFDYYESLINENGLVGDSKYHMFVDWYLPKGGNSPVNKDGNSAILTLNYAYTLSNAGDIAEWLGYRKKAAYYRAQSRKYAEIVKNLCFDPDRGIYADDPGKTFYDQRASILAILADAHTSAEKKELMRKVLDEDTEYDSKANLFYYFYLFEAMKKTGVGNFTETLKPWEKIVEKGMTATPEKRIEQNPRSEVHPWTAHPVHYYFTLVAGIEPDSPGFRSVNITPQPGQLKNIEATYPTKHGNIILNMQFDKEGKVEGNITLPDEMTGSFRWKGEKKLLQPGPNKL
ncbi:MAG: family 78 glycoside hydrolase catalytic domain [Bacteroidales bacterium]|nr:family 78 glycoside hydrolase catalytic domain [Bacteroidales bacterium]